MGFSQLMIHVFSWNWLLENASKMVLTSAPDVKRAAAWNMSAPHANAHQEVKNIGRTWKNEFSGNVHGIGTHEYPNEILQSIRWWSSDTQRPNVPFDWTAPWQRQGPAYLIVSLYCLPSNCFAPWAADMSANVCADIGHVSSLVWGARAWLCDAIAAGIVMMHSHPCLIDINNFMCFFLERNVQN